jgi:hypothetical protein
VLFEIFNIKEGEEILVVEKCEGSSFAGLDFAWDRIELY